MTSHPRILTLHRLVLLFSRVFCSNIENIFLRNDILYYLSRSHVMDTSKTCLLVSKAPAEMIDCVTECLTWHQISCLKFHPNFRSHCGHQFFWMPRKSVVYLVGTNTRQPLYHKSPLTEDVSDQLNGCYSRFSCDVIIFKN